MNDFPSLAWRDIVSIPDVRILIETDEGRGRFQLIDNPGFCDIPFLAFYLIEMIGEIDARN
jgi:hypothetical protein